MIELGLATIPGFFGVGGGPGEGRPYGVYRPAVVPAELVPQHVVVARRRPDRGRLGGAAVRRRVEVDAAAGPDAAAARRRRPCAAPLGRVVGARSGDKGGNANLGVFARTDEAWAWLDGFLTVDRLRALLPETADLAVDRHRLPAPALAQLRDPRAARRRAWRRRPARTRQAKSLGEWLRARVVDVPAALLPDA